MPPANRAGDQFDTLVVVRHKPVLEDSLKPSRLCRVSGRNGGQFSFHVHTPAALPRFSAMFAGGTLSCVHIPASEVRDSLSEGVRVQSARSMSVESIGNSICSSSGTARFRCSCCKLPCLTPYTGFMRAGPCLVGFVL